MGGRINRWVEMLSWIVKIYATSGLILDYLEIESMHGSLG